MKKKLRAKVFCIRLSADEWGLIQRVSALAERTETDWARRALLRLAAEQAGVNIPSKKRRA